MSARARSPVTAIAALAVAAALALAGCSNPDALSPAGQGQGGSPANAGEPQAPAPPPAGAQAPAQAKATPREALAAFASTYINWTYKTLAAEQRALAAIAVGPARLSERQAAAASAGDTAIARGRVWNRGEVVGIAPDRAGGGEWVVVTREETGGNASYEGLGASYHVTLAKLAAVPGGWAVAEWSPET